MSQNEPSIPEDASCQPCGYNNEKTNPGNTLLLLCICFTECVQQEISFHFLVIIL